MIPAVGMGATIYYWSDRLVGTVVQVSGKRIVIQEDTATRIDSNGMSDSQRYSYIPNLQGQVFFATLRKDGKWRVSNTNQFVELDTRNKFYDYSF